MGVEDLILSKFKFFYCIVDFFLWVDGNEYFGIDYLVDLDGSKFYVVIFGVDEYSL